MRLEEAGGGGERRTLKFMFERDVKYARWDGGGFIAGWGERWSRRKTNELYCCSYHGCTRVPNTTKNCVSDRARSRRTQWSVFVLSDKLALSRAAGGPRAQDVGTSLITIAPRRFTGGGTVKNRFENRSLEIRVVLMRENAYLRNIIIVPLQTVQHYTLNQNRVR